MNMMMNMMNMMKKDTYIRRSLRLTLEQDIYHTRRTLLTIQMCNMKQNDYSKWPILSSQRMIKNYWIPVPIRELTLDSYPFMGINTRFTTLYVNQLKIPEHICELALDSCPYIGINIGFLVIDGNP